jgi:hypothetical protein
MPDFGDVDPFSGETNERTGYGALDQNAPSVANGQISPAQWAEYQARRKRDAILGSLLTVGGMFAAGPIAGAIGGGGAAGSAASSAGGLAPVAGGAPWAVTPYAGSASMVGTGLAGGAAGAAGAGAGGIGSILGGMSARDLAALGLSAAGTIGGAMSNRPNFAPNTATSDPQLQALMRAMQGRLDKSEPLYDSVLQMANGLLPSQYQKGGGGMR